MSSDCYLKSQLAQLVNVSGFDAQLQLRGSGSGKTNWLALSPPKLEAIEALLLLSDDDVLSLLEIARKVK